MNAEVRYLSPPTIAKILGIHPVKVIEFIARGELRAINTSLANRPRWRISPEDFDSFCENRASRVKSESVKTEPTPRRKKPIDEGIPKTF